MELILKYFPRLTEKQKEQFAALYDYIPIGTAKST